jgi:hypothetical protein
VKVLLDENFPTPPGFDPTEVDNNLQVTTLFQHDPALVGNRTPDWYLYLVAQEAAFDALVTRDWRQSAQNEEMWVASRTDLSIITWKKPQIDPIVEWGQLLAYMPQLRKLRDHCGPSVFFLPSPSLSAGQHVEKAKGLLKAMSREQQRSPKELSDEARSNTVAWLEERDLFDRFAPVLRLGVQ